MGKLQDLAKEKLRRWNINSAENPDNIARNAVTEIGANTGLTNVVEGFAEGDPSQILSGLNQLAGGPKNTYVEPDPLTAMWSNTNTSYSGTDVVPIIQINGTLLTLGSVQTISISTFREKEPVRVLGKSYVKGYTAGPRTIAGSITFTLFNRDPFWEILKFMKEELKTSTDRYHTPLGDQIPPVNLILWFSNEYGRKSLQTLYGIEFTQEGQVHSINDVYSEKTVNYVARDMDILIDYDDIANFRNLMYQRQLTGQFNDDYLVSLTTYKSSIERQIQDCNIVINRIKTEQGKIAAGAVFTFGMSLFGSRDLKDELAAQVNKKTFLVNELINTDAAIIAWSKTAYNSETYYGGGGTAVRDELKKKPNVGGPAIFQNPMTDDKFNSEYDALKKSYKPGPTPDENIRVFDVEDKYGYLVDGGGIQNLIPQGDYPITDTAIPVG